MSQIRHKNMAHENLGLRRVISEGQTIVVGDVIIRIMQIRSKSRKVELAIKAPPDMVISFGEPALPVSSP